MKKITLFQIIVFLIHCNIGVAQNDEPCRLILQNGLYKNFKFVRTGKFEQDLKTYFSSDQFLNDYRDKKWSGGIDVVVDGVPLGLKADSKEEEVKTFHEKIKTSTTLKITSQFYDFSLSSIPDVDLAKEYTNCLVGTRQFGFKPSIDIGENEVTVTIFYQVENNIDPLPKVTSFSVLNGQILSGGFRVDQEMPLSSSVVIKRMADKDLIFSLVTNKGVVSYRVPGESIGFNKDLPVGTIIASFLNFEQFNAVTSNNANSPNGLWTSKFSKWAPADGRPVPNSKFTLVTGVAVPDLRGVFLRGLNQFDMNATVAQDQARNDPKKDRVPGDFQDDNFENHTHGIREVWTFSKFNGNGGSNQPPTSGEYAGTTTTLTSPDGRDETRPKNRAIFYYIRIN